MGRRRRQKEKGTVASQIEWLRHRTGYPTAEEREKLLQLRSKLSIEIVILALSGADRDDPRFQSLFNKYGKEEVLQAERAFREGFEKPSLVADDARSNRDYRLRYSRFGAGLPFLSPTERNDLYRKYAQQVKVEGEKAETNEADQAEKLLLMDWRSWEDITPPAVPPRPDNYSAPQPAHYTAPIAELLEWGNDLQKQPDFTDEREYLHWKKHVPALTRMALDPGLLNGWPSESASWAPWHAIHMLGNLQSWDSIPALAELADLEDDWLSDHLPHIWADMGREAEPMLWMILEDNSVSAKRRGLAAEALYRMTQENEVLHNKVVKGFVKILKNEMTFHRTLNAHLISFLQSMNAVSRAATPIQEAFDQNRVDLEIISPEDLEEDDFEDEIDEDEDERN